MEISEKIQGILATLPPNPAVYIMKNAGGTIIYVGKAISLRNRVRSYFHADTSHDAKTRRLVREIADIEWIVVGSELEALILEMNLIKKHRPKYNIRLKDDKRYPYIKVHWADPFPKVTVTRQMVEDGSRYFGPYTSAWAVYQTLDVLRRIFPYLTCDRDDHRQDQRACLYYDIKLCIAPCIGAASQAQYRQMISDLMDFLGGHSEADRRPPARGDGKGLRGDALRKGRRPARPAQGHPVHHRDARRSSSPPIIWIRMCWPWRAATAKPACRSSSSAAAS